VEVKRNIWCRETTVDSALVSNLAQPATSALNDIDARHEPPPNVAPLASNAHQPTIENSTANPNFVPTEPRMNFLP
jgi:hypothetical protein